MTDAHNVRRVPNVEATPRRTIRVPDDLWQQVKRIAADRNETITAVVIRALRRYVALYPDEAD